MHFEVIPFKDNNEIIFLFVYTIQNTIQHFIMLSTSFLCLVWEVGVDTGEFSCKISTIHILQSSAKWVSESVQFVLFLRTDINEHCKWTLDTFNESLLYC